MKMMNILIPAAGKGSRFQDSYHPPKPNIVVDGKPMLVTSALSLGFEGRYIFVLRQNDHTTSLANDLFSSFPGCKIAVIDFDTDGPAETALIAKDLIDNDDELVIANCDQIMSWNEQSMLKKVRRYDAGLVCIRANDPKHSYAKLNGYGHVEEVKEKEVISDLALTGIHYWKKGKDFVSTAEEMLQADIKSLGEFYIGPTYTLLAKKGKTIGVHLVHHNEISFIGTPEDLKKYNANK